MKRKLPPCRIAIVGNRHKIIAVGALGDIPDLPRLLRHKLRLLVLNPQHPVMQRAFDKLKLEDQTTTRKRYAVIDRDRVVYRARTAGECTAFARARGAGEVVVLSRYQIQGRKCAR